jgi:hypothetical protein
MFISITEFHLFIALIGAYLIGVYYFMYLYVKYYGTFNVFADKNEKNYDLVYRRKLLSCYYRTLILIVLLCASTVSMPMAFLLAPPYFVTFFVVLMLRKRWKEFGYPQIKLFGSIVLALAVNVLLGRLIVWLVF